MLVPERVARRASLPALCSSVSRIDSRRVRLPWCLRFARSVPAARSGSIDLYTRLPRGVSPLSNIGTQSLHSPGCRMSHPTSIVQCMSRITLGVPDTPKKFFREDTCARPSSAIKCSDSNTNNLRGSDG